MVTIPARVRSAWLTLVLAVLATASLSAQTPQSDQPSPPAPRSERAAHRRPAEPAVQIQNADFPLIEQTWIYTRPIVRIGQDYTLKAGETVRDVRSVLADVRIEGHVEGDVVVSVGNATLSSTAVIDGSLVVVGGSATVAAGSVVHRDFVVIGGTAETAPDFSPGGDHVIVGTPMIGQWLRTIVPWLTRGLLVGRLIVPDLGWVWAIVGVSLLIGLLLNHIFDRQVAAAAASLAQRPITAFFMGLLVLLLAGPILVIVAASVIGLAIVPFAIAAMLVATLIGKIGVARVIGRSIVAEADEGSRVQGLRSYLLGAVVITIAYMIPVLGLITWGLVGVFGLGCATMSFAATLRRERPVRLPKATTAPPAPSIDEPPTAPPIPEGPPPSAPASAPAFGAPGAAAVAAPAPGVDLALYPRASFLDRVAALALDVVLIAIVNAVMRYPWGDGGFLVIVLAYQIGFLAWRGTTLGGVVCGLRVVRTNGADLRFVDAVVRELASVFSIAALGIGCFWMLNDAERQTWHDKIAGTIVVKLPREMVLA